jgi:hypothetical protein
LSIRSATIRRALRQKVLTESGGHPRITVKPIVELLLD